MGTYAVLKKITKIFNIEDPMFSKVNMLKSLPLFANLTSEESKLIFQNSRSRNCKSGNFLFIHGDIVEIFYILFQGTIQIFRETPNGHEMTSDMMIATDSLNAHDIINKHTMHIVNARAVDDVFLLEIPMIWLRKNFHQLSNVSKHLMIEMAKRLHIAQIEAEHLSTMSAAQMVACYLQRLCVLYEFNPKKFTLPYSKTLIASRLHMELETFSRATKRIKQEGIIISGKDVSFVDQTKINDFSCHKCSLSADCTTYMSSM